MTAATSGDARAGARSAPFVVAASCAPLPAPARRPCVRRAGVVGALTCAAVAAIASTAAAQSSGYVSVGVEVSAQAPREDDLAQHTGVGITVRLPRPDGWGFALDMGTLSLDLEAPVGGSPVEVGALRVRPLLGGIAYTHRAGRFELTGSVTGGWTFGGFEIAPSGRDAYGERLRTFNLSADASSGPAVYPKFTLWYDLTSTFGATFSAGYLVVRPDVTLEGSSSGTPFTEMRRVTADTWRVGVGLAFKVF